MGTGLFRWCTCCNAFDKGNFVFHWDFFDWVYLQVFVQTSTVKKLGYNHALVFMDANSKELRKKGKASE
jgi:hypothetical protein